VARLSPFDRLARLKTDREVGEPEFVATVVAAVLEWQPNEREAVDSAWRQIRPAIARLALPLPARVNLIKTSGREEGKAPHTRGDAVVLPASSLRLPEDQLRRLLAHELFHVASRAQPEFARALYAAIGFHYCGELEFPADLAPRKITNPDAPLNDYCVQVQVDGKKAWAIPILFSSAPRYDPARGGEFFATMRLSFALVRKPADAGEPVPASGVRAMRVVTLENIAGFYEQVGRNTDEILHPEEIVADNFALLVVGERNVPSPDILARIEGALVKGGGAEPVRTPRP
jgi:hypothetical protein